MPSKQRVSPSETANCRSMIWDLMDADEGLNGWEIEFLEEMLRWSKGDDFTAGQAKKITEIYRRCI